MLIDLARFESNTVSKLHSAGRFADAAVIGRRSLQRLSDPRLAPRVWVHVASNLADVLFELGDWDEAERCLDKIEEVGPPGFIAVWSQLDHAVLQTRPGGCGRRSTSARCDRPASS